MTREEAVAYFKRHIDLYCVQGMCREAEEMAIKALELIEYIEQRYEEEFNERREHYADGRYHGLSMSDGASYALGKVLDKWKENTEDKE